MEDLREATDVAEKLRIGDATNILRIITFPKDGDPIAPTFGDVAIEAVLGDVQDAVFEPPNLGFGEVPIEDAVKGRRHRRVSRGERSPETFGVLDAFGVESLPCVERGDVGRGRERCGGIDDDALVVTGGRGGLAHGVRSGDVRRVAASRREGESSALAARRS
jgi:hypothetical protein